MNHGCYNDAFLDIQYRLFLESHYKEFVDNALQLESHFETEKVNIVELAQSLKELSKDLKLLQDSVDEFIEDNRDKSQLIKQTTLEKPDLLFIRVYNMF